MPSALHAAARITAPVHGADDCETLPGHSRRVFDALRGPKRLVIVPGAAHNGSLRSDVWPEIAAWLDARVPAPADHDPRSGSQ